jgi:hypothetical protein
MKKSIYFHNGKLHTTFNGKVNGSMKKNEGLGKRWMERLSIEKSVNPFLNATYHQSLSLVGDQYLIH